MYHNIIRILTNQISRIPGSSYGFNSYEKQDGCHHCSIETITSVIKKILEKILLQPIRAIIEPQMNNLQRGFTPGSSATNTALLVSEAIAEKRDQGKPLYALFLDASKAFDLVYHYGMLNSIHDLNIQGDMWMLLNSAYEGITSTLKWKGTITEPFEEGLGMRQGDYVSPDLFRARGNRLLNKFDQSKIGMHIGSTYIGAPTCADDIALLAENITDLQTMAYISWDESTQERYLYSTKKSKTITFSSNRKNKTEISIDMNGVPIENSYKETHLGTQRTSDGKAHETIEERQKSARRASYALMGAGMTTTNILHPRTSRKLLYLYVIPTLVHSLETLDLTEGDRDRLDGFMRDTYRRLQALPKETANCASNILLGTLPIQAVLDSHILGLFIRILHLDNSREKEVIQRQLVIKDIDSASWMQKVRRLLWKYDLPSVFTLLQNPPEKERWKRMVKSAITAYWSNKIVKEAETKSTLKYLNKTHHPDKIHPVWDTAQNNDFDIKRAQVKARLLVGRYTLKTDLTKYRKEDPTCLLCKQAEEDIKHFLLECPALEEARQGYMKQLKTVINMYTGISTEELENNHGVMIQYILDCSVHLQNNSNAITSIEPITRKLCYALHAKRSALYRSMNTRTQTINTTPAGGYAKE